MIMYDYDSNAILSEPIKNRQAATIRDAFLNIHKILKSRGSDPKVYIMNDECSSDLKEAMKKYKIDFQLDSPHVHRQNAVEREIQKFKNHFISRLSTTYPDFPISEWGQLLSQCMTTLNIHRNSRVSASLSAYAYLFGTYGFNKLPMEPPVTRVIFHDKPGNRTSWVHHGTKGWYSGPSLDHHRCMQCYMPSTCIV